MSSTYSAVSLLKSVEVNALFAFNLVKERSTDLDLILLMEDVYVQAHTSVDGCAFSEEHAISPILRKPLLKKSWCRFVL